MTKPLPFWEKQTRALRRSVADILYIFYYDEPNSCLYVPTQRIDFVAIDMCFRFDWMISEQPEIDIYGGKKFAVHITPAGRKFLISELHHLGRYGQRLAHRLATEALMRGEIRNDP